MPRGRLLVLFACLLGSQPAAASHDWGGLDVCTTYRDTVPPGIAPALLPDPHSEGATLLQRYCTQCHELPGPGRHVVEEWPAVLDRMHMLMDVSRRFRGLMGQIEAPSEQERQVLQNYLSANALQGLSTNLAVAANPVFTENCSGCHATPDPRQHAPADWPAVVERMERHRTTMGRGPLTSETRAQITLYLKDYSEAPQADQENAAAPRPPKARSEGSDQAQGIARLGYLTPFFGLIALGAVRLWRRSNR